MVINLSCAVNKSLILMIFFFLFTLIWGVLIKKRYDRGYCAKGTTYDCDTLWAAWVSVIIMGSLVFLGVSVFYIKDIIKSKQKTQEIEFNTNTIELGVISSGGVHDTIDPTQNKLTEEDFDKEIALFEKRKKLAQLKNEVINLETVGVRASTSESLGQVVSVNRGY